MFRIWALTAAAIAVHAAACASPFTGPVSPLYFQARGGISVLQGTQALRTIPHAYHRLLRDEGVFAVSQTLRTRGADEYDIEMGETGRSYGGEYTLTGTPTGVRYVVPPGGSDRIYDGTTDGRWNYFVDHIWGGVYRTDYYWGNPQLLFYTGTAEGCTPEPPWGQRCSSDAGIAYDPYRKSLWISARGTWIREFSLDGQILGIIPIRATGLALDPADHTLWLTAYLTTGLELQQWSINGEFLQGSPEFGDAQAAEFAIGIPEPATSTLFAGGLVMLAACGWRRTRSRKNGGDNSRG